MEHTCSICSTADSFDELPNGSHRCRSCGTVYNESEFSKLKDRGISNAFAEFGTLCHELFEGYANGEYSLNDLSALYEWKFEDSFTTKFPYNKYVDLHDSYYQQGLDFFRNWDGFPGCEIIAAEEHFEIPIDDWILNGFIDLSYKDASGRNLILDYKSKKDFKKDELKEYARQPYLYSLFYKEKYGCFPDALQFYTFRSNKIVEVPFKMEELEEALAWARDTVQQIRNEWSYERNPDQFFCCNLCNHRLKCKCGKFFWWMKK